MPELRAIMIAPSRYEGRQVAVFRLGMNANGGLGAVAGLAEDYNRRHAPQSRIDYEFFDEHVREAVTSQLLCRWRDEAEASGQRFVVMLCGVQTVTYPRARDIALMARREGIEVLAGGVHLSAHGPSVDFLVSCGVHVAIGEVEPIWDDIIGDALRGRLRATYRISPDQGMQVKSAGSYITAPDITDVPLPHIPRESRGRYVNRSQLFVDSSRGCPFLCTFCVVKNVFGRTVRSREPARLVAWLVERARHDGFRLFSFTDDNFVRNPRHREVLEGLAAARASGAKFSLSLILDVEATCYAGEASPRGERTQEFLRLCRAAGVGHVYIGLESTSDAALQEAHKGVNRSRDEIHAARTDAATARVRLIQRYRTAVQAWQSIGVAVECGYILGFDADGRGVGADAARDLLEIGVDVASFYLLTPLPGAENYAQALRDDRLIERDFNQYFQSHPLVSHPVLASHELEAELKAAVRTMWSWPNVVRRIGRRVLGLGGRRVSTPWTYLKRQLGYRLMISDGLFTFVEGGVFRRRQGRATRPRQLLAESGFLRRRGTDGCREAITDADARRFYLGEAIADAAQPLPAIMSDASRMESLPLFSASYVGSTAAGTEPR